ncbi:hypothetical protein SAMN02746041_01500 [Desulfacinum hydrothermale DSM 13146]|uniref:Uncharacterized protein n=1 Tax=Desulfacinum hydrothermale DSM 13146 TaxID=1121390 RepID=A0A1W1XF21_9BACT|nr:hypothetical protein [Desulfacinum hydrothermale]SMC22519.1 hypothetical protein SAMN02746041_01500 [Desulfacinum hydrothermale DSM 13146]
MHPRGHPETPGRAERLAVWGVLALLLAVAVGVWVRQFHADPFLSATALPPSPGEASGPSPM